MNTQKSASVHNMADGIYQVLLDVPLLWAVLKTVRFRKNEQNLMSACTFFGHRDCPETIKPKLREVVQGLIINQGVETFYVGHQGQFDAMVRSVLRELKKEYPQTRYAVVLAYMPGKRNEYAVSKSLYIVGICNADFGDNMAAASFILNAYKHFS